MHSPLPRTLCMIPLQEKIEETVEERKCLSKKREMGKKNSCVIQVKIPLLQCSF